jgi:hypothetical protein
MDTPFILDFDDVLDFTKDVKDLFLDIVFKKHTEEVTEYIVRWYKIKSEDDELIKMGIYTQSDHVLQTWHVRYIEENCPIIKKFLRKMYHRRDCCTLIIVKCYLDLWCKYINEKTESDRLKTSLLLTLERVIMKIPTRPTTLEYVDTVCGCDDNERAQEEDSKRNIMEYSQEYPYEFEDEIRILEEKHNSWRHNLDSVGTSISKHIQYLKRVPHRNYRNVFFPLASVLGQDCAKNVLSFL